MEVEIEMWKEGGKEVLLTGVSTTDCRTTYYCYFYFYLFYYFSFSLIYFLIAGVFTAFLTCGIYSGLILLVHPFSILHY